jgi:hypothetical protein
MVSRPGFEVSLIHVQTMILKLRFLLLIVAFAAAQQLLSGLTNC